ncbi:MAG: VWA domain-containing protein [Microbacteriaceae bacterium]|nr:VWA domain-containing protein [Microbacteriaceae bacterium]
MNVKALLDVDMVALEAADKVTLMLDLTAPENAKQATRSGQAVQVVLDRSGSMQGQPLDAAKGSLLKLVDRLAPQDAFGLVAFDDTALVIVPTRTMADHHMPSLRKAIRDLQTGGSTDISAGYLMGLRELTRVNAAGGSTLLLISDGHANAGEQDPKFFAEVSTKSATDKVTTSTIGLGNGYKVAEEHTALPDLLMKQLVPSQLKSMTCSIRQSSTRYFALLQLLQCQVCR